MIECLKMLWVLGLKKNKNGKLVRERMGFCWRFG